MARLTIILLTTTLLLSGQISNGQTKLSSNLSLLFGDLPMDLPTKKIIAIAENDKHFTGRTHYNLDISYSGIATTTNFFKLKPDTCFIEIVSNAAELFPDSAFINTSFFSFDASYDKADTIGIRKEFVRMVKLFSTDFSSGKIEKEDGRIYFFKSKGESKPTLTLYLSQGEECYTGKRCIKLTYFKS